MDQCASLWAHSKSSHTIHIFTNVVTGAMRLVVPRKRSCLLFASHRARSWPRPWSVVLDMFGVLLVWLHLLSSLHTQCSWPFRSSSPTAGANSDTSVVLNVRTPWREEDVQNYDPRFRLCELVLQRRALLHRVHGKSVAVGHTRHTPFLAGTMFSTWSTFGTQSMRLRLPSPSARIIVLDIFT